MRCAELLFPTATLPPTAKTRGPPDSPVRAAAAPRKASRTRAASGSAGGRGESSVGEREMVRRQPRARSPAGCRRAGSPVRREGVRGLFHGRVPPTGPPRGRGSPEERSGRRSSGHRAAPLAAERPRQESHERGRDTPDPAGDDGQILDQPDAVVVVLESCPADGPGIVVHGFGGPPPRKTIGVRSPRARAPIVRP